MAIYSDINTSSQVKKPLVYDAESVSQSIDNFFMTSIGTRFFRPEIGSSLRKSLLFELDQEEGVFLTLVRITQELERWDNRVQVDSSTEVKVNEDEQKVDIKLVYRIRGLEDKLFNKNVSI